MKMNTESKANEEVSEGNGRHGRLSNNIPIDNTLN